MKRSKKADSYGVTAVAEKPPAHQIPRQFFEVGAVPDYYRERGWYETHRGFNRVVICTEKFLRDLARKLWENKRDHGLSPYLAVHVKGPSVEHKGGMVYEGAKPTGWQTDGDNNEFFCLDHKALCTDGKDHDFYIKAPIKEIVSIHVLS